jgi:hypothetical protein
MAEFNAIIEWLIAICSCRRPDPAEYTQIQEDLNLNSTIVLPEPVSIATILPPMAVLPKGPPRGDVPRFYDEMGIKANSDVINSDEHTPNELKKISQELEFFEGRVDDTMTPAGFLTNIEDNTLSNEIYHRLNNLWLFDRSAAFDQIGTETYSELRRTQLASITGAGHIAALYGFRTAQTLSPSEDRLGLRIEHPDASAYHRSASHESFRERCLSLYSKVSNKVSDENVVFVHSHSAVARIHTLLLGKDWNKSYIRAIEIIPGLVAIEFHNPDLAAWVNGKIPYLGVVPSAYEIIKYTKTEAQPTLNYDLENEKTLSELEAKVLSTSFAKYADKDVNTASWAILQSASSLIKNLAPSLRGISTLNLFKKDETTFSALAALSHCLDAMPTLISDSSRLFACYQTIIEEINVILSMHKPYYDYNFKEASSRALDVRSGGFLGRSVGLQSETFLLSSGMDAITTGMMIARDLSGATRPGFLADSEQNQLPDYWETVSINNEIELDVGEFVLATVLNPSLPMKSEAEGASKQWTASEVVSGVRQKLSSSTYDTDHPLVLILDTTVEIPVESGKSDLSDVLLALEEPINTGILKMVLCKSYQKYPSLGTGKIMAGGISLIAKSDDKTTQALEDLRAYEAEVDWMKNDESQLMTHFLMNGSHNDLHMIGAAAENADFVSKVCFRDRGNGKYGFDRYQKNLPFGVIDNADRNFKVKGKLDESVISLKSLIEKEAEERWSFGILGTSSLFITDAELRLTFDQERREELLEKFYGVGWLCRAEASEIVEPSSVQNEISSITANAVDVICRDVDPRLWGDSAVRALRRRAAAAGMSNPAIAELEDRLGQMRESGQQQLLDRELKDQLAKEFNNFGATKPSLRDNLELIGAAFAPRLGDANRLHGSLEEMRSELMRSSAQSSTSDQGGNRGESGASEVRYAANMVASMLNLMASLFRPEVVDDESRLMIESTFEDMLEAGLPGISASSRSRIINDWLGYRLRKDPSASTREVVDIAEELSRFAHMLPYREDHAKLSEFIDDADLEKLSQSGIDNIVRILFKKLDFDNKISLYGNLNKKKKYVLASASLDACVADLRDDGKTLQPERLSDLGTSSSLPRIILPEQIIINKMKLLRVIIPESVGNCAGFGSIMKRYAFAIAEDYYVQEKLEELATMVEQFYAMEEIRRKELKSKFARDVSIILTSLPKMYRENLIGIAEIAG